MSEILVPDQDISIGSWSRFNTDGKVIKHKYSDKINFSNEFCSGLNSYVEFDSNIIKVNRPSKISTISGETVRRDQTGGYSYSDGSTASAISVGLPIGSFGVVANIATYSFKVRLINNGLSKYFMGASTNASSVRVAISNNNIILGDSNLVVATDAFTDDELFMLTFTCHSTTGTNLYKNGELLGTGVNFASTQGTIPQLWSNGNSTNLRAAGRIYSATCWSGEKSLAFIKATIDKQLLPYMVRRKKYFFLDEGRENLFKMLDDINEADSIKTFIPGVYETSLADPQAALDSSQKVEYELSGSGGVLNVSLEERVPYLLLRKKSHTRQPQHNVGLSKDYLDAHQLWLPHQPNLDLAKPTKRFNVTASGLSTLPVNNALGMKSDVYSTGGYLESNTTLNPSSLNWPGLTVISVFSVIDADFYGTESSGFTSCMATSLSTGFWHMGLYWNTANSSRQLVFKASNVVDYLTPMGLNSGVNLFTQPAYGVAIGTYTPYGDIKLYSRIKHASGTISKGYQYLNFPYAWYNFTHTESVMGFKINTTTYANRHPVHMTCVLPRELKQAQVNELLLNPWQILERKKRVVYTFNQPTIFTETHNPVVSGIYEHVLTAPEKASISDYNNLLIKFDKVS